MDVSVEKAISFLIFIGIGILLKKKIAVGDETNGIKSLILTIALPSTIFLALLKVSIDADLVLLPFFALLFNVILFFATPFLLSIVGIDYKSAKGKTARLLIPSLAPGLSCFPFILEFLGDNALAKAAMADLGNKFFVLFALYLIALKWYYKNALIQTDSLKAKLISLVKTLLYEPVNLFIISALVLVSFGITLDKLPNLIASTIDRLSYLMTPLVLIFIGLAVKICRQQFFKIFSLLMLRAAFTLLLIAGFIEVTNLQVTNDILVMISFTLSACSFWPFAHISAINFKEQKDDKLSKTFDTNFALSILALSLPISVLLILGILTAGNTFATTDNLFLLSIVLGLVGGFYPLFSWIKKKIIIKKTKKISLVKETTIQFLTEE